jgi:putative ABC transport system ATP-binding protein
MLPLLSLDRVSRVYGRARVQALDDVSLTITRGEYVALSGPSGCGKSTLLHVACGLDHPTAGRVLFEGQEPKSSREWARLRAERIGFVFQAFHLLPTLSAAENVEIPMIGVEARSRVRRQRALELLERMGLADRASHLPGELSGGECQRVAIARCLANDPDVVLADEPTGNLDSAASARVLDLLSAIQATDGTTLVIATHDAAVSSRASRSIRLLDGQVQA